MSKVQHHLCWSSHPLGNAGATFPYPIYAKWADAYKKEIGVGMNYQSIGSGGGIQQIEAKTVTFGATDAPLNGDDLEKNGLVQFPMVIPWQTTTCLAGLLATACHGKTWRAVLAAAFGATLTEDQRGSAPSTTTPAQDGAEGPLRARYGRPRRWPLTEMNALRCAAGYRQSPVHTLIEPSVTSMSDLHH